MAAVDPTYEPEPEPRILPIPPDPREFRQILRSKLLLNKRTQRDIDEERGRQISNEFDWERMEAPTVSDTGRGDGTYWIEEAQHRIFAIRLRDLATGTDTPIWCAILPKKTTPEEAQLALDIAKGRRGHTAYEQWMLRSNAKHEHEVLANIVLQLRGLRLGKSTSAASIGAVATVRTIVHGGGYSPEYGADLLARTLDAILEAFPNDDPESTTTRWERHLLLAVAGLIHRNPDSDQTRLARALRVRPAQQWIALGSPAEHPAHFVIGSKLADQYNRGLRRGRIGW